MCSITLPEGDNEADEAVEAGKSVMEDEEEKEKKPWKFQNDLEK